MVRFGDDTASLDEVIKNLIIDSVTYANQTAPRSLQQELGPSQISDPCDRKIVYQLVHGSGGLVGDPWPATVGTAIHAYLEKVVPVYGRMMALDVVAEAEVAIGPGVTGHSDLYVHETVVDYKSVSRDALNRYLRDGAPVHYRAQVQLYGLGFEKTGRPVKNVALAFLPRDGQLRNSYVWVEAYDPEIATRCLDRYLTLKVRVDRSDFSDPTIWGRIPATPGNSCGFCPWYQVGVAAGPAGCPGR